MSALMDIAELRERACDERRAPTGRPAAATLTLGTDWADLPLAGELGTLLPRVPVAGVRLAQTVDLAALPSQTIVRVIALLRECSSIGAQVSWSLALGADDLDLIPRLDHLPAPASHAWRSSNTFGLFYFRRGPGFLSVVDRRSESIGRTTVADPVMMDVFRQTLDGCAWPDSAAARRLVDLGLVLRLDEHCVALPVHMRSWPIGAALLGGTLASAGKNPDKKV
jgi:hypothetical protein